MSWLIGCECCSVSLRDFVFSNRENYVQTGQQTGTSVWPRGFVALALSCGCRSARAGAVVHFSAFTIMEVSISHHGMYWPCWTPMHRSLISTTSDDWDTCLLIANQGEKPVNLGSCSCWQFWQHHGGVVHWGQEHHYLNHGKTGPKLLDAVMGQVFGFFF